MTEAAIAAELAKLPVREVEWIDLDADDEGISAGLFAALGSSWHRAPAVGVPGVGVIGGERTGLILSEIRPAAELIGVEVTPAIFGDLRAMEMAALAVWAAKK